MAQLVCDFKPVTHITIDTIGSPGERTFFLQASQDVQVVTLVIEKEHAYALAAGVDRLLEQLDEQRPEKVFAGVDAASVDLALRHPVDPLFRVGQLGLGYDETEDLLAIVAYQLPPDPDQPEDILIARFWATREQMRALSQHTHEVVTAGRPACVLCGEPIDPDGHFCPRGNGDGQGQGWPTMPHKRQRRPQRSR